MVSNKITIEVAYASVNQNWIIPLELNTPVNILTAIEKSGILKLCPDLDLAQNKIGIYGEIVELTHMLKNHDRIEIYRPVLIDPMVQRSERVKKTRKTKKDKYGP